MMEEKEIFQKLVEARDSAIAEYSGFKVGAVLVTAQGEIYTGHNIESSSYSLTICAERVALFKALSEGEREFKKIYIISNKEEFCPPCGACRQVLMDFAPDITVILQTPAGQRKEIPLKELLPLAFTKNKLK